MKNRDRDFESLDIAELTALIAAAENVRLKKIEDAKSNFLKEIKERAAILGINIEDILHQNHPISSLKNRRARKDVSAPHAAKYRGPEGEEWSGRGRPPKWISVLEEAGKKRNDFLV